MLHRALTYLLTLVLLLTAAMGVGGFSPAPARAQDGTPAASPAAGPGAGPAVGDAVVLFSNDGDELAQIAVTDLVDPYEETSSDAKRGFHYVLAEIVVENTSGDALDFNPYQMSVVDGEGFTYQATFASRSSEAIELQPDFQTSTLEPGATASGVLFFEVIDGAAVELVVYTDSFERFVVLVDEREAVPGEGEGVPTYDNQGDEVGMITVEQIVTELEELDPEIDVERGQTMVAVVVTAESTAEDTLTSPASSLRIVDEFGVFSFPTFAFRGEASMTDLPDFPSDDIPAGESVTGAILFTLPSDAVVTYVLYQPEYTKLTIVGQPGEGSVVSGEELEPVPAATEEPTDEPTEEPTDEPTPAALSGDCADLQEWVNASAANLDPLDELDPLSDAPYEAKAFRDAADLLREAAEAQGAIDTPAIAEEGQEALLGFLDAYITLLEDGAERLDAGEDGTEFVAEVLAGGPFREAFTVYEEVAAALAVDCPDVDFEGGA